MAFWLSASQTPSMSSTRPTLLTALFFSDINEFVGGRERLNALSSALRRQREAGAVLAAYCTGNGRAATTHWAKAADFARRHPHVEVRAREILTEQDGIVSGGSVTSYLNLAVRLVEMFAGEKLAAMTAKSLLIDLSRISQASYATLIAAPVMQRLQLEQALFSERVMLSGLDLLIGVPRAASPSVTSRNAV